MQRAAKLAEKMARVLRIVRIAMRPFRVPGPSLVRGPDFAAEFSLGSNLLPVPFPDPVGLGAPSWLADHGQLGGIRAQRGPAVRPRALGRL